jgi:transglutaminase-like putative cysteine protease
MKEKLLIFLISSNIFSLFGQSVVWANSPSASQPLLGNYHLEYRYEFINSTKYPIDKVIAKGLLLLKDTSEYYSLVNQNIDGETEKKENMFYFTKQIEDIKPKTVAQILHEYTIQLNPISSQIDLNKIQPLKNREIFNTYLNPEPYIESNHALIKEMAHQLVGNENNPYTKAKILYEFVATKMKYNLNSPIKNTGSINAIEDIKKAEINQQQGGVCYDYATLYAALLRSQDIPARVISGFKISPYDLADLEKHNQIDIIYNLHSWVEFYLEPYGWLFADPTIDFFSDDNDVFQNFIETNNLYIKKGYNLPFDILEYSIKSENKSDIKIRQSAILKKNVIEVPISGNKEDLQDVQKENQKNEPEEDLKGESDNNNHNPIQNHQDKEETAPENETGFNMPKQKNININNIIEYRKESVYKVLEYQKAKKEYKKLEYKEQLKVKDQIKKNTEIKNENNNIEPPLQFKKEGKTNLFQKIILFFIKTFNKLLRGDSYGVY